MVYFVFLWIISDFDRPKKSVLYYGKHSSLTAHRYTILLYEHEKWEITVRDNDVKVKLSCVKIKVRYNG